MSGGGGPYFTGGPKRDLRLMAQYTANFRNLGGLPSDASLVLSQLLLNMAGRTGIPRALQMIEIFLKAADCPPEWLQ